MRSLFPTFRRFLAMGLCAGMVLVIGCAREKASAPQAKPSPPVAGKQQKPKNQRKKPNADPKKPPVPQIRVIEHRVTLNWIAKEGTQMAATAKSASFNEITQSGTLLDFSGKLYENGKLTATMSAPRAVADTGKRTVTATGGVVLKSLERKTVVNAQRIRWYAKAHKVVGVGGVKITSTSGTIDGAAFVADTALKTISVKDSAKGLEF